MKIGFLGGAFDPPHIGHYKIIEYCINIFDKLLIIPNKISPMHNKEIIASEYHRMNMLNLLFENENIKIDDFELSSNKKNYTYYTIKYLENKYKGDSLTMILGEDQLNNLDNWYYYPREYIEGIVLINQNKREAGVNKLKAAIDHLNGMIEANPDDPRFYMTLGLTYARIGDAKNAIKLGNRATEILPISRDALDGPTYEKQLAVIYGLVGENEKALKKIEYLSTIPAGFHYGELLYEPSFDSIRDDPRFQTVIKKLKPQS